MTGTDAKNKALRDRLLGSLIGLARAASGNEDLINDVTHMIILEGLCLLADSRSGGLEAARVIGWAEDEKRRIVPNCFSCAAPCGRTADCDTALIHSVSEAAGRLKRQMLADICAAAIPALETMRRGGSLGEEAEVFYSALFALGEDWPEDYLSLTAQSAAELGAKAKE